ncbi:hypothetical protein EDB83DRAFT_2326294 [Lactarius deliciosus]|nr:hypothetical protein EDB83DRAFT_2326294 [Lactarius deliciosus]
MAPSRTRGWWRSYFHDHPAYSAKAPESKDSSGKAKVWCMLCFEARILDETVMDDGMVIAGTREVYGLKDKLIVHAGGWFHAPQHLSVTSETANTSQGFGSIPSTRAPSPALSDATSSSRAFKRARRSDSLLSHQASFPGYEPGWSQGEQAMFETAVTCLTASAGLPLRWVENPEWLALCERFLPNAKSPSRKVLTQRLIPATLKGFKLVMVKFSSNFGVNPNFPEPNPGSGFGSAHYLCVQGVGFTNLKLCAFLLSHPLTSLHWINLNNGNSQMATRAPIDRLHIPTSRPSRESGFTTKQATKQVKKDDIQIDPLFRKRVYD